MTELRYHQRLAHRFASCRPASLLGLGMGSGKTAIAQALCDDWGCLRTLVLCPASVRGVWRREIALHASRETHAVILDHGSIDQRTTQAARALWQQKNHSPRLPVTVVANYEAILHQPFGGWITHPRWDLVILDESHRVSGESQTAARVWDLTNHSQHRLCLTGTPFTQAPLSVWAQCRFLDPSVFGEDLEEFKWEYENTHALEARKCIEVLSAAGALFGHGPCPVPDRWKDGTINTEEYLQRLSRIAFRIEPCNMDLPPLTVEKRTFCLSKEARELYDGVAHGHWEELSSGRWRDVAESYAVTMRLQQITSGWIPDRSGGVMPVDSGKQDMLEEVLVGAAGEPVVVFCRFVRDLDITEMLAKRHHLVYGEISHRRKDALTPLAQMADGLQVVGVQEQAGGAGIDLSASRIAVDYSPSWSLATYEQKVARLHRPPQNRPVLLIPLIADRTIDCEIHRALAARRGMVSRAVQGLETLSHANLPPLLCSRAVAKPPQRRPHEPKARGQLRLESLPYHESIDE